MVVRVLRSDIARPAARVFLVTVVVAWSAWLLWNGSIAGAAMNLVLVPVKAIYWIGFALPIPWVVIGIARLGLILTALTSPTAA